MQAYLLSLFAWVPGFVLHEIDLQALESTLISVPFSAGPDDTLYTTVAKAVIANAAAIFPKDAFVREGVVRVLNLVAASHQLPGSAS